MSNEPEPVALNGQGVVTLPTTGTVAKHDRPNQAAFDRRVWPANRSPAMGASWVASTLPLCAPCWRARSLQTGHSVRVV